MCRLGHQSKSDLYIFGCRYKNVRYVDSFAIAWPIENEMHRKDLYGTLATLFLPSSFERTVPSAGRRYLASPCLVFSARRLVPPSRDMHL